VSSSSLSPRWRMTDISIMTTRRHRRSELRVGAPKASMRTYYYLDYSHAIDVIKWRMYKIQNEIDKKLRNVRIIVKAHGFQRN
jgi:transcription initiation factor IIE alpha subunit